MLTFVSTSLENFKNWSISIMGLLLRTELEFDCNRKMERAMN